MRLYQTVTGPINLDVDSLNAVVNEAIAPAISISYPHTNTLPHWYYGTLKYYIRKKNYFYRRYKKKGSQHSYSTFFYCCKLVKWTIKSNKLVFLKSTEDNLKYQHKKFWNYIFNLGRTVIKKKLSRYMPWGERRYSSYSYLTSALDGGERSASRPSRALPPGETTPSTHWIGGWVGPRAGLDAGARRKILCPCRGSNADRPACSQTLYCLRIVIVLPNFRLVVVS
jgi:hypothetical protein